MMTVLIVAGGLSYYFSDLIVDRSLPSYLIGNWVMTRDIYPGGPIAARFVLVRHKDCRKRIELELEPGGFVLRPEEVQTYKYGLDVLTIERQVPMEMASGDATYIATFFWTCVENPVHWVWPLTLRLEMPVVIQPAEIGELDGRNRTAHLDWCYSHPSCRAKRGVRVSRDTDSEDSIHHSRSYNWNIALAMDR